MSRLIFEILRRIGQDFQYIRRILHGPTGYCPYLCLSCECLPGVSISPILKLDPTLSVPLLGIVRHRVLDSG